MEKFGVNQLREMFLSFFETKGHLRLPSFSLIPQNDPSLLLINAGMSPMKTWFTGEEEPPRHRVCTCQKCIRTPDIENIGKTARHGTFFEMLGNFSFGDYFKHEAIAWSWEFLTSPDWVGLDPERLYPSVYVDDDEAWNIWHEEIGIPAEKIFRFGKEDNFWEHGSGPCGPCSEIYFDRGEEFGCGKPGCTVGCDCDRYIEIWNNVFTQFDNDGHNNYTELASKNIDTGMGLERLAVVCQGVDSLFDVDTVMNITNKVSEITGARYGQSHDMDVSLRIITDHIRGSTFMIGDGVLPSNEGRGYVLRRLLRRAARQGKLLGVNEPFLYRVCETVIQENQPEYSDLLEKQGYITRIIRMEEENFAKTIDGGIRIFNDMLAEHRARGEKVFSGADAFKLYDTFGFPLDLTRDMAAERDMTVDEAAFASLMKEQRERARAARSSDESAWAGLDLGLDNTPTAFTGYDSLTGEGEILALVVGDELRGEIIEGDMAMLVLDKTPFYAEMGGQAADHGLIELGGSLFEVTDVQKNKGGKYLHHGVVKSGSFKVGDIVKAEVDTERRRAIMRAHSCTHLLQKALRTVLGEHVEQAGSLVEPDKLRFDFTHFAPITPEEQKRIDEMVNDAILEGMDISIIETTQDEARKMGAMALFGEKYGDIVRVVSMGDFSKELCGGTHLANTARVGSYRSLSEFSVASGVRRIEGVVGKEALRRDKERAALLSSIAEELKTNPAELRRKVEQFIMEQKENRRLIDKLRDRLAANDVDRFLFGAKDVRGLKVITAAVGEMQTGELRKLGDTVKAKNNSVVAVFAAVEGEKITLLCVCGKEAVSRGVKAGDIIREISRIVGGSGGGKPDSAMGGGRDPLKLDNALAAVDELVDRAAK